MTSTELNQFQTWAIKEFAIVGVVAVPTGNWVTANGDSVMSFREVSRRVFAELHKAAS